MRVENQCFVTGIEIPEADSTKTSALLLLPAGWIESQVTGKRSALYYDDGTGKRRYAWDELPRAMAR